MSGWHGGVGVTARTGRLQRRGVALVSRGRICRDSVWAGPRNGRAVRTALGYVPEAAGATANASERLYWVAETGALGHLAKNSLSFNAFRHWPLV
jgi:hypothetical protein